MTRRMLAVTLAGTGLVLALAAPAAWLVRPDAPFGTPPPEAAPTPVPPAAAPTPGTVPPEAVAPAGLPATPTAPVLTGSPAPTLATRSARLGDVPAGGEPAPVRLRIPALGVDTPVDPVGVVPATGEMEVPDDVRRAGWYRHGSHPGATVGAAVVAAHVDSASQGAGAFFRLGHLRAEARIEVDLDDGSTATYVARAKQHYDKESLPTGDLFARDGAHRLVLITCGGPFDAATGHYLRNVVVVAEATGR